VIPIGRDASRKRKRLSAAEKGQARKRARAAGRPYPDLVDDMTVAKQKS
jgi:hypothetical protein